MNSLCLSQLLRKNPVTFIAVSLFSFLSVFPATGAAQQEKLHLHQSRQLASVWQDSLGNIWGSLEKGPLALVKWNGKAWDDTPLLIFPHPKWTARLGPPWLSWRNESPWIQAGKKGTLLAVMSHDVYQDALSAQKIKVNDNWMVITKAGDELAKKYGKTQWLDAWLFDQGKWLGPLPIEQLLKKEQASLTKNFTEPPKQSQIFSLQSDGKRLWAYYEAKVHVLDGPNVMEWPLPVPNTRIPLEGGLCILPDGEVLCSFPFKKGYNLQKLKVEKGKITAEAFPTPGWPEFTSYYKPPAFYVAKDKTLWLWLEGSSHNKADLVWQFQNGKWLERKDLEKLLFEDADGSLWFMPGRELLAKDKRGYPIVQGNKTVIYPWPKDYPLETLTLSPTTGKIHALCARWLVTLGPAPSPLLRPLTAIPLEKTYGPGPAFLDSSGHVILNNGFLGKLGEAK